MKRILLMSVILAAMLLSACTAPSTAPPTEPTPSPSPPAYILQLLSTSYERAYDYITMSGEVKNISSKNLENVMVVVSYYTDDGTFVKSDDALIGYNPILPGQTSPFESITTDNPAIKTYKITFKFMFGGTIPTKDIWK